ncbi:gliding motility lipoprotein GldD [Lacinutrix salivirga]
MKLNRLFFVLALVLLISCGEDPVPKPKAFLSLEYPEAVYKKQKTDLPFTFDKNQLAEKTVTKPLRGTKDSYGVNIEYPKLKGTIYLTYKPIKNPENELKSYLQDAQNFTQEHTLKADEIFGDLYENPERKVYGMFYEVGGDAASPSQFYVTDSTKHFLTGSLYFYAKPNYDSILPAANYLRNDIKRIMETVEWR